MSGFRLTKESIADLSEIWDYVARDDVGAADRLLDRFYEVFDLLAGQPNIGHSRSDLTGQDVLFWPFSSYLINLRNSRNLRPIPLSAKPLSAVQRVSTDKQVPGTKRRRALQKKSRPQRRER